MSGKITRETNAPPECRRGGVSSSGEALRAHDVRRVQPFLPSEHFEFHGLTLGECLEAIHLNRREMHEHVLAAFLLDETIPLRVVEPLHLSPSHFDLSCEVPTPRRYRRQPGKGSAS